MALYGPDNGFSRSVYHTKDGRAIVLEEATKEELGEVCGNLLSRAIMLSALKLEMERLATTCATYHEAPDVSVAAEK